MKKFLIILVFLISFTQVSFWLDKDTVLDDNKKTIKELKNNIEDLKEEKVNLKEKYNLLIEETWELKKFFNSNLKDEDYSTIKEIVKEYNVSTKKIEEKIKKNAKEFENSETEKKLFLIEKIKVYKKLVPFIDKTKLDNYLEYIKWDLKILGENKDVSEQIYVKEEIISKKVEKIKEKIVKNNEVINEKLKKIVNKKIEEKIDLLKNSEKFKNLDNEWKRNVISKIQSSIQEKIDAWEKDEKKSTISKKKLELYKLLLSSFNDLYIQYQDK